MSTAFIIGNGESRLIFPIEKLKGKGQIYGCNAIYRDNKDLCEFIVSVNPEMSEELIQAQEDNKIPKDTKIYTVENLPKFEYALQGDHKNDPWRNWHGSDVKQGTSKSLDFATHRGSGCSAVQLACENGNQDIFIIGFDMLGAVQWEMNDGILSRKQNNVYKNTKNYPTRVSMKAYLKFEWIYHLRQLARYYNKVNFYYVSRSEYLDNNIYLRQAMETIPNFKYGIYADLKRVIEDDNKKGWKRF